MPDKVTEEQQKIQNNMKAILAKLSQSQKENSDTIQKRQQFGVQLQESVGLIDELQKLQENNTVYKLYGSVMLKQDPEEAKQTAERRKQCINENIERCEKLMIDQKKKIEELRNELVNEQMKGEQLKEQMT